MKLLPLLVLAMVVMANNARAVTSRMAPRDELLAYGMKKTATAAEGTTSIDNHHAIPRPDYDNWSSSPGNMPAGRWP
ncbi:hypothetical protein GUJ93_ZPchr0004g38845 [Zizania palustris]|uniref:Uncharacterized protein n=1 Tax=Zizania palustris TaxID=103762 RepID=A0A8J5SA22_ZIZPA|nr:hypothetical protein GUJ93_ZPchr0004g38845 [Zizania palustris]